VLHRRQDIPAKQMARLVEIAREHVQRQLGDEFGKAAAGAIEAAVTGAADTVGKAAGSGLLTDDFDNAVAVVRRKADAGGIFEEDVVAWVRGGRIDEALAAVAHLAGVPVQMVVRAYRSAHHDPLLFILRSVRFGWGTFKVFLNTRAGRALPPEMLRGPFEAFQQLSVQTAQRVVRFTAARERATQSDAA
jgi:hypothetical protein